MDTNKKLKFLLILIILIVISIIVIICFVFYVNRKKPEPNLEISKPEETQNLQAYTEHNVTRDSEFYRLSTLVNVYFDRLNKSKYKNRDGSSFADDEATKKSILYTLSDQYVNENNITLENLYEKIPDINTKLVFIPIEMKVMEGFGVNQYAIYGKTMSTMNTDIQPQEVYIIVNVDYKNNTFSIEPQKEAFSSLKEVPLKHEIKEIYKNTSNEIQKKQLTNEEIINLRFSNIKVMNTCDSQLVYDRYLDKDYKEKRFPKYEDYQQYLEISKERFEQAQVYKYSSNQNGDVLESIYSDSNDRYYYLFQTNCSDFTIMYDSYTVLKGDSLEKYQSSSAHDKVQLNIARWIEMINNKDYIAAFNVLDETFKQNNFKGDINVFKETMDFLTKGGKLVFQNDDLITDSFTQVNNNYVQKIVLRYAETSSQTDVHDVTGSVVMKLLKNNEFTMSYDLEFMDSE